MEHRLMFEHLMCKAFNTDRFNTGFVNANHYDYAHEHLEAIQAYMVCALFLLKDALKEQGLQDLLRTVYNNGYPVTLDKLNKVLERLSKVAVI